MGSENSKSDDERVSRRNKTSTVTERLFTEDEINRALTNQKKMFEAKLSKMKSSSRVYPNLETQNLNTINTPSTSDDVNYRVAPSAPSENLLFPPSNTSVSQQSYRPTNPAYLPRSAGPSYGELTSNRPLHTTLNSAGPTIAPSTSSGLSHVPPPLAGTSLASPNLAGPSHTPPIFGGPSHALPIFAGPSHAPPPTAGPYKNNKKYQARNRAPRTKSTSRVKQNKIQAEGIISCVTCNGQLTTHIYQCNNGHSSCDGCRFKMARCGNCNGLITEMRNITLESTLAEITINTEERVKCPNAKDGCCLHFNRTDLQNHLKECPYKIMSCPVMEFSGDCSWQGTTKQLTSHFIDAHPKHREADVNKEMHIILLGIDFKTMHLVEVGNHQFLVHIQVDNSLNNIYMVIQYLGTNFSASKWFYEWHIYNKKEPRRKCQYMDVCTSSVTPISEIINNNNCAVININYATSFLDSGKLTFKFYIKKRC